jgi:hypothetical protein
MIGSRALGFSALKALEPAERLCLPDLLLEKLNGSLSTDLIRTKCPSPNFLPLQLHNTLITNVFVLLAIFYA